MGQRLILVRYIHEKKAFASSDDLNPNAPLYIRFQTFDYILCAHLCFVRSEKALIRQRGSKISLCGVCKLRARTHFVKEKLFLVDMAIDGVPVIYLGQN